MDHAGGRPLGIGETLDLSLRLYGGNFPVLLKATASVLVPVLLLQSIVEILLPAPGPAAPGPAAAHLAANLAGRVLVGVISLVASMLATAAAFKAIADAYLGETPDWRHSLRFGVARLGSLVWLALETGFVVMVAFIFFILPGVWAAISFVVAMPVLLLEGLRGRHALGRSRRLVSGRWWPTFATVALAVILQIVAGLVVESLIALLVAVGAGHGLVARDVGLLVGTTAAGVLLRPFGAAVITVIYFDLRLRKEGFGREHLAAEVATLADQGPPVAPPGSAEGRWVLGEMPPSDPPPA